jgi:hypothetical protein
VPTPTPVPVPKPTSFADWTPEAIPVTPVIESPPKKEPSLGSLSTLSTLFDVDETLDIDDSDIELVEPRSDTRWQKHEMLLPLDRPLPKVEDRSSQTVADEPIPDIIPASIVGMEPIKTQKDTVSAIPKAATAAPREREWPLAATEVATATPVAPEAPVATEATETVPTHAAMEAAIPTAPVATATEAAVATAPEATTTAAPTAAEVATATATATPVTATATAAAAAATMATTTIAPATSIYEADTYSRQDVLATDDALDIDDSENEEYYDEDEDEGRSSRLSSPIFILIVLLILILQMLFIGLLVSTETIDISGISNLFNN